MKALVVTEPNRFSIEEVPMLQPGAFELLCKVKAVKICGTDAHLLRGDYSGFWPPGFPFIPGHEWSGEVVEMGPGSAQLGWNVGDRVMGTSHDACGYCQKCVEGSYNLCENYGKLELHRQYGHNWQGSFAEYVVHGAKSVFRLPDSLSFSVGAGFDPASIAMHTANRGQNRPGDTVVVLGPGPIGLLAADGARIRGAGRVIVVGRGYRLDKAAELGHETFDMSKGDPVEWVRETTDGLGADVILECAGVPQSLQWSMDMVRRGGRISMVGIPVEKVEVDFQNLVLYEHELVGVRASSGEMRHIIPLIVDGRLRVQELITHHFPLDEFATALSVFNERREGSIMVIIEP